jgi:hypothetical protein
MLEIRALLSASHATLIDPEILATAAVSATNGGSEADFPPDGSSSAAPAHPLNSLFEQRDWGAEIGLRDDRIGRYDPTADPWLVAPSAADPDLNGQVQNGSTFYAYPSGLDASEMHLQWFRKQYGNETNDGQVPILPRGPQKPPSDSPPPDVQSHPIDDLNSRNRKPPQNPGGKSTPGGPQNQQCEPVCPEEPRATPPTRTGKKEDPGGNNEVKDPPQGLAPVNEQDGFIQGWGPRRGCGGLNVGGGATVSPGSGAVDVYVGPQWIFDRRSGATIGAYGHGGCTWGPGGTQVSGGGCVQVEIPVGGGYWIRRWRNPSW